MLAHSEHDARCEGECFIADMLRSYAWFCAVPSRGTCAGRYLRHTLQISGVLRSQCSKGSIDLRGRYGYLFDNAWMTESLRVGPLPLLVSGLWGKEPN